jgi:hypothetical protein
MIRKLIISAAILTALIVSKESHAAGAAGFARDLAGSPALAFDVGNWDLSQRDEGLPGKAAPQTSTQSLGLDRMTTGNVADSDANAPDAVANLDFAWAGEIRLPSDISLFHPF